MRTNSTSLLWDNNPRLLEITTAILDPKDEWLANAKEEELEVLAPLIWNDAPNDAQKSLIAQKTSSQGKTFDDFLKGIANWLNQHEVDFIKESWQLRLGRIKQLTDERNRAIANEWAAKAVTSLNRKTAFRLAELAHAIDPAGNDNLTVKEKLLQYYYFSTEPPFYSLDEHGANVSGLAFSNDGTLLATSGDDRTIRLWDTATGASLHHLEEHSSDVSDICFWPGSRTRLVSASHDKTLKIWEKAGNGSWEARHTLHTHDDWVKTVAVSPDGKYIASGDRNGQLILWSAQNARLLHNLDTGTDAIITLEFSPNSQKVVIGKDNKIVSVFNIKADKFDAEATFTSHLEGGQRIYSSFFLDDEYGVSGTRDRKLWCWKINGQTIEEHQLLAHDNERADFHIRFAIISPDKRYLVISEDKVFVYEFNNENKTRGQLLHALDIDARKPSKLVFSKNGNLLAGTIGSSVKVWSLAYREFNAQAPKPDVPLSRPYDLYFQHGMNLLTERRNRNLAVSPDHKFRLEAKPESTQFHLINNESNERKAYQNSSIIRFLTFLKDGSTFLSGDEEGKIKFWKTTTLSPFKEIKAGKAEDRGVVHVAFSKDEQFLISVMDGLREVKLWKKEGKKFSYGPIQTVDTGLEGGGLRAAEFSPDETSILAGGPLNGLKVYGLDLTKKQPIATIAKISLNESPYYAHYSDDGQLIFTYDFMGALRVWDAEDGALKMSFPKMINTNWGKLIEDSKKWLIIARRNNFSRAVWYDSDELIKAANQDPWMGALTPDEISSYQIEPYLQLAGYLDASGSPAPIIEKGNEDMIYNFGCYFAEKCGKSEQADVKAEYLLKAEALFQAGEAIAVLHKKETYQDLLKRLKPYKGALNIYHIWIAQGLSTNRKYLSCDSSGGVVDLWTHDDYSGRQQWIMEPIAGQTDLYHIYIVRGVSSNRRYLNSNEDGTKVNLIERPDSTGRQNWKLELIPGYTDLYHILIEKGVASNRKYLNGSPDGMIVDLTPEDSGSGRQQWRIKSIL